MSLRHLQLDAFVIQPAFYYCPLVECLFSRVRHDLSFPECCCASIYPFTHVNSVYLSGSQRGWRQSQLTYGKRWDKPWPCQCEAYFLYVLFNVNFVFMVKVTYVSKRFPSFLPSPINMPVTSLNWMGLAFHSAFITALQYTTCSWNRHWTHC